MTSCRRTNEPSGREVESSTAGASGGRDHGKWWDEGSALAGEFTRWAAKEGLLSRISEQECADLAKAFMAGYLRGIQH